MNRSNLAFRLAAAAAAGTVTLSLFASVVSIAEPQQSVLTARLHRLDAGSPAVRLAGAANVAARPAATTVRAAPTAIALNDVAAGNP